MWYGAGICSLTASLLLVKLLQVCLNSTTGQFVVLYELLSEQADVACFVCH